ncbi:MAG TPA: ribonuclease E/G [Candidatus Lokiarchaeia archaeon]|nr:ribonuclease E/G [Candidatus Lokiarchaeia archaeon]
MPSVKIRGIYSTALTELMISNQFSITQPSNYLRDRFPEVNFLNIDPDIIIEDTPDAEGIFVHSRTRLAEISKFPITTFNFPELITNKCDYAVDAIYKAKVIRNNPQKGISFVQLRPQQAEGKILFDAILDGVHYPGRYFFVQVSMPEAGNLLPKVITNLTFSGKNIVFVLKNPQKVLISKKIGDKARRNDLFELGKTLELGEWGLIMRTEAQYASNDEIVEEYEELKPQVEKLVRAMKDQKEVGIVQQRYFSTIFQFSLETKERLDEIRNKIVPTVSKHHSFKASGRGGTNFDELVNFAEFMVTEDAEMKEKVEHSLFQYFFSAFTPGTNLNIEHQKLSGQKLMLSPGTIETVEVLPEGQVKVNVKRKFRTNYGTYDGLEAPKQEGDYATAEYISGADNTKTQYFRESGEVIGTYYNLNSPVEFIENGLWYIDYELDVVEDANGERKLIDEEAFQKFIDDGVIEKTQATRIQKRAADIQQGAA